MLKKTKSTDGFQSVKFKEHIIVDYHHQDSNNFDVTASGHPNLSADFMVADQFDHFHYCFCLVEKVFVLPPKELSPFLDYQCAQLRDPWPWLALFYALLSLNKEHDLIRPFQKRRDLLNTVFMEKKWLFAKDSYKNKSPVESTSQDNQHPKFDIVKVKEELQTITGLEAKRCLIRRRKTDYLQEVEQNQEANFIRAIDLEMMFLDAVAEHKKAAEEQELDDEDFKHFPISGTPTQLADFLWQLKLLKNKKDDLIIDISTVALARLGCRIFCNLDGTLFVESTIRRNLTGYDIEKRRKKKDFFDLDKFLAQIIN